jgi:hypothetical protein
MKLFRSFNFNELNPKKHNYFQIKKFVFLKKLFFLSVMEKISEKYKSKLFNQIQSS